MSKKSSRRDYVKYVVAGYYGVRRVQAPAHTSRISGKPEATPEGMTLNVFTLRSDDFADGGDIPSRLTCEGEDVSPRLSWGEVPEGTESFALSVVDLDAPSGPFVHWLLYDIPGDLRGLGLGMVPEGARQVENDFGELAYRGPCPPREPTGTSSPSTPLTSCIWRVLASKTSSRLWRHIRSVGLS